MDDTKDKSMKKYLPIMMLLGGIALAVLASKGGGYLADQFLNGVGYQFTKLRLKLLGLKTLRVTGILTVTNQNPVPIAVNSFGGALKYGRSGNVIAPINTGPLNVPANGSGNADFLSEIPVTQLGGNLFKIVQQIADGTLKKLWLSGTLYTSVVAVPVETEITPFSE